MPDITISEFAEALRHELDAKMRVHRVEMATDIGDVKDEVARSRSEQREQHGEVLDAIASLAITVDGLASTVNDQGAVVTELVTVRAAWTTRVQLAQRVFTSAPGIAATAATVIGAMTTGAIALF